MKTSSHIIRPESNRFLKALIFSPPGHGKTRLLETAQNDPRTYPMLLLDYEGGTSSLVGSSIDIFPIRSWEDFNEAYALLADPETPYRSVGIDSISETHIMALMSQLTNGGRSRKYPDLLEQGDYGIALVQMRKLLRSFRDLPMHVITSALAKDDTDPREGTVKKPSLAGAMADEAPGIFDLVGYLSLTDVTNEDGEPETRRILLLQGYSKFRVKVRVPKTMVAPNEIWDPTITSILDALGFPPVEEASE